MLAVPYMSSETRLIFLPDAENRTIVSSFVWTKHRNVTNRQTDGRNRSGYCGRRNIFILPHQTVVAKKYRYIGLHLHIQICNAIQTCCKN